MNLPKNLTITEFLRCTDDLTPVSEWREKLQQVGDDYENYESRLRKYAESIRELENDLEFANDQIDDLETDMTTVRKLVGELNRVTT